MLKSKIVTLGAAAVMGVTSLGVPQVIAHADTTKSGDTVVSYTGTAPQPKDWGISVPATINESKDGSQILPNNKNVNFKYGVGKLAIVNADGNAFEDTSKNRIFSLSSSSQYVNARNQMVLQTKTGIQGALVANITDQGATEPTTLMPNMQNTSSPSTQFTSKASGNTESPLVRYIEFASPITSTDYFFESSPLDPSKSYSDTISWTASEIASN